MFFERLDEELNKVNQFYRTKETEFLERGELLNKQLQIMLDLKKILTDRRRKSFQSRSNSGHLFRSWSGSARNSDFSGECLFSKNIPSMGGFMVIHTSSDLTAWSFTWDALNLVDAIACCAF